MGITKTLGFTSEVTQMADLLKVLGHPARLSIMEYLAGKTVCVCGEIVNELPLAQSTVSRHLSELKRVGLIQGEIEGNNICYCINQNTWNIVKSYFAEFTIQQKNNCC